MTDSKDDIYDEVDGMRFFDYGRIHTIDVPDEPDAPMHSGTQELWIGGRTELGCTERKYRVFEVLECERPDVPSDWSMKDCPNSKTMLDVPCYVLKWNFLLYDNRDAYRAIVTLTFEDRNDALSVKDDVPWKILCSPICDHYEDDEGVAACFSGQSVVRESRDLGRLLLEDPTLAERQRLKAFLAKTETESSGAGETATHGCLTVYDDFEHVTCHKVPYDLSDANHGREMLRFLSGKGAFGAGKGQHKSAIHQHIRDTCGSESIDWRPAHAFRGKLGDLYKYAIGCDQKNGLYWINP